MTFFDLQLYFITHPRFVKGVLIIFFKKKMARESAALFRTAEGVQFLNCRPKPAARFCVDAGRQPKERFPRYKTIYSFASAS